MKKFVQVAPAEGTTPAKYELREATLVDTINPTVPVDSTGSLIRTIGWSLLSALLTR